MKSTILPLGEHPAQAFAIPLFLASGLAFHIQEVALACLLILLAVANVAAGSLHKLQTARTWTDLEYAAPRLSMGALAISTLTLLLGAQTELTNETVITASIASTAAIIPGGLALILSAHHVQGSKKTAAAAWHIHNVYTAVRSILATVSAQLSLVLISIVALVSWRIAPAITPLQLIAIDTILLLPPLAALSYDAIHHVGKPKYKPEPINRRAINGLLGFGLLAGALVYANYLFFFVRHNLAPNYLDPTLPLYHQATSLSMVSLTFCMLTFILLQRSDKHKSFFANHLTSNWKLLTAFGATLVLCALVVYNPALQELFDTAGLDLVDWAAAIFTACCYLVCRLLQRHTRKYTRQELIKLHRELGL